MKLKKFQLEEIKNVIFLFLKMNHLEEFKLLFYLMMIKKKRIIIDGSKTKSSTNGTWIFGTHSFEIKDQLMVEILNSKIIFSLRIQNKH
jgi:hypothetical protein